MDTLPKRVGPVLLAGLMRELSTPSAAQDLWNHLHDHRGSAARALWERARLLLSQEGTATAPTVALLEAVALPEARRGRPRIGIAADTVARPTKDRDKPRQATQHQTVRLGVDQDKQVAAHAARHAMSGNAAIRAAVARLLDGSIPLPDSPSTIPAAAAATEGWRWIPDAGQMAGLAELAHRVGWLDYPPPADPELQRRYDEAPSIRVLASEDGVSFETMRKRLIAARIRLRQAGRRERGVPAQVRDAFIRHALAAYLGQG